MLVAVSLPSANNELVRIDEMTREQTIEAMNVLADELVAAVRSHSLTLDACERARAQREHTR